MIREDYVPFGRPDFSSEEISAVTRVLTSGWVGMGPETLAFEQEMADYLGTQHVVTVNSCTSALFLSLLVHGVGSGDEVICPSLTWCSSSDVALHLGAEVVFCDVDPDTLCVTPATVMSKLTERTKAVVVVHFGGLAVDVAGLRQSLPRHVTIVEDAAHAFGSCYPDSSKVGSSENLTCFSFYGNKNLSTAEGGAVAVKDEKLAERLRSLRQHGMPQDAWKRFSDPRVLSPSHQLELGYKMNYTDFQACIGRVQLRRQADFQALRLRISEHYTSRLAKSAPEVGFQSDLLHPWHARHLFVVRLPIEQMAMGRDDLLLELRKRNVGASVHYPPLHMMPIYHQAGKRPVLPNTERIYRDILTLPISASLTLEDAEYVMEHFLEAIQYDTRHSPASRKSTPALPPTDNLKDNRVGSQAASTMRSNLGTSAPETKATTMDADTGNTYGFAVGFSKEFPSQIAIDATDVCNLACEHCPHSDFKKTQYYQGCFLDPGLSNKAVDEAREHGAGITEYIRFSGEGEPLLHKDIHSMVAYAVQRSGSAVTLTTNGTVMDETHSEELVGAGIDMVDISIDAYHPETYAKIRVRGDLQVTRSNVLNLIKMAKQTGSRTKVVVSYIEQPRNIHETTDFEQFWQDRGADFVVVRRLHSGAGMIPDTAEKMRSDNLGEMRRPCTYPWERIVLNPRGCLSFCPADWEHASTLVDYSSTTIVEAWRGRAYEKLREAHLTNNFREHLFCGQCPDWSATRWPDEGRSYRHMVEELKSSK